MTVSVMVAMDQSTVIKVLEYHLNWFEATGFTEKQVSYGGFMNIHEVLTSWLR